MIRDETAERRTLFSVVLHPHRSLSPQGFRWVMGLVAGVSLAVGLAFYLSGAWPVLGFCGVDVALVYWAFRANYRAARLFERIDLTERELLVQRVEPKRPVRRWRFIPYWLSVAMDDPPRHDSQVRLRSHGRTLVVGAFLPLEERAAFARQLRAALQRLRQPVFPE